MLELGKSGLLPLLLLLPHNSQGMDGCEVGYSDGYGDFGREYWKCGDVCTYYKEQCSCGGEKIRFGNGEWCCGGVNCEGGKCLEWAEKWTFVDGTYGNHGERFKEGDGPQHCAKWSPAVCTTGFVQNLNKSCAGECNHHPEDIYRNWRASRSYVAACSNNTICVKEGEGTTEVIYDPTYKPTICTGDASCDGELQWCQSEERKNETCPRLLTETRTYEFTRCPGLNRNKSISTGQCIHPDQMRDGEAHCLDRSDENPFQKANGTNKERLIDFSKLKNCTFEFSNGNKSPGLECSRQGEESNCIWMGYWCKEGDRRLCPVLGEDIYTDNPTLCGNITFWRQQPCGKRYGEEMIRCQGGNGGQCVEERYWGVEGAKDFLGTDASCTDGSDLYRPIKPATKVEETGRQDDLKDSKQKNNDVERNSAEKEKPTTTAGDRNSAEPDGGQASQTQMWKTRPRTYQRQNYTRDKLSTLWFLPQTDPFEVPAITTEVFKTGPKLAGIHEDYKRDKNFSNFYSSDDYVKDETTNLMMAPTTEESCKVNDGFVCEVEF